jgi:hypothetical protein
MKNVKLIPVSAIRSEAITKANELTKDTQRQHRIKKVNGIWHIYDAVKG